MIFSRHQSNSLEPIRNWSTERAACRPSRCARSAHSRLSAWAGREGRARPINGAIRLNPSGTGLPSALPVGLRAARAVRIHACPLGRVGKAGPVRSTGQFARTHEELVYRARCLSAFALRAQCAFTPVRLGGSGRPGLSDQRGNSLEPMRNWSTERAACRPSRPVRLGRVGKAGPVRSTGQFA